MSDQISLPKGGGALTGIGETFQPDLHTGTGNLSIPISVPPGRGGLTPHLSLDYSSASGNGPFGLGWSLAVPRISRRTDRGVPVYNDSVDVFVLSGAEELAPVPAGAATPVDLPSGAAATRYRPRTESGYARINHVVGPLDDYWDIWTRDGLRNRYGTARPAGASADWTDPAAIHTPTGAVFSWLLSYTRDSFGNRVAYTYTDDGQGSAQRYLNTVSYADYGNPEEPEYAATVKVDYDPHPRPDPFSDRRPGFELRTTRRAARVTVTTVGSRNEPTSRVELSYADEGISGGVASRVSVLSAVQVFGHDAATGADQALPPLTFTYSDWSPQRRRYRSLPAGLPSVPLGAGLDLVDLFGDGRQSLIELDSSARYWLNVGGGVFDRPRTIRAAPGGAVLGRPGVLLTDVDGDGRPDLVVSAGGSTTVWTLVESNGRAGFATPSRGPVAAPSVGYTNPQVRFPDLNGDHVPDLLLGGQPSYLADGDGNGGYARLRLVEDPPPPLANLADPHVFTADLSGDTLTDLVEVYDGNLRYWPNLGHGRFGPVVQTVGAPRFSGAATDPGLRFDPRRLLFADVTGSGAADVIYVGDGVVTVWVNCSGNGFAAPFKIHGTPRVANPTTVRACDLDGGGISGILWSGIGISNTWAFLDLTGEIKPYLLTGVNNHRGATTTLDWSTSTAFANADRAAGRPWATKLPFPVHVVATTTSADEFAGTTLSTTYRYHDGYWDPADREFRGFGRVEQIDSLSSDIPAARAAALTLALDPLTPRTVLPAEFDAKAHGNRLSNWTFDQPRDGNPSSLVTTAAAPTGAGLAAAADWTTWNNCAATTNTELVPSDLPQGTGGSMLHVKTDGLRCGIVQTFDTPATAARQVVAEVWVRIVRGSVVIGTGNGGDTSADASPAGAGSWMLVSAGNQSAPATEFVIYSDDPDGADFYVDHAWIRVPEVPAQPVDAPPTRTVTWFHLGPVGPAAGAWTELDPSAGFWAGDPPLQPYFDTSALPSELPRPALREALRGLRGRILRSEVYADDGDPVYGERPYEVHDSAFQVAPVLDGRPAMDPTWLSDPVITVREVLTRTACWDRGTDPLTTLTFSGDFDDYSRPAAQVQLGVARGRDPRRPGDPCLATVNRTTYATADSPTLLRLDCAATVTRHEAIDRGNGPVVEFGAAALAGTCDGELRALEVHYYDGDPFDGLPAGILGDHGLDTRVEELVITPAKLAEVCGPDAAGAGSTPLPPYLGATGTAPTDAAWSGDYPKPFQEAVQQAPPGRGTHAGFAWHDSDDVHVAGYYRQRSRQSFDVQTPQTDRPPRGLVLASRDAYGGDTTTGWDAYDLNPAHVKNPVGLETTAEYDYRVFKPAVVTDPNGNRTTATYTPLGQPATVMATGREDANEGDTAAQPSFRYDYDLTAYDEAIAAGKPPQPMAVTTVHRVDHRWTLVDRANAQRAATGQPPLTDGQITAMFPPTEETDYPERFLRSVDFSDGFGRLLQTRLQADELAVSEVGLPDDLSPAAATVTADIVSIVPAVIVSSWKIYDNKGRPIIAFEPFRSAGYAYVEPRADLLGELAAIVQHYDPRGRPTVTVSPDGSQTRQVYGEPADLGAPQSATPTPWVQFTYDANDNAARSAPTSSLSLVPAWDTPSSHEIDCLARPIRMVERGLVDDVVTTHDYDIDGHLLAVTDPLGRTAARTVYDLLGRPWRTWLLDAGTTRTILDAAGGVVEHRDDKGALILNAYDPAHRHVRCWAADRADQDATLRQVLIYGDDDAATGLTKAEAAATNLLGRPVTSYDEAGLLTTPAYDLDGNPATVTRRVLRPEVLLSHLPAAGSGAWSETGYAVDWQPGPSQTLSVHAETVLDTSEYTVDTQYDALGRHIASTAPADATGARAAVEFAYGRGGGIVSAAVDGTPYVQQICYDAHGRRTIAQLGNGVLLRYSYDPRTLQLRRQFAQAVSGDAGSAWTSSGPVLQDASYRHDPCGNLTSIGDRAPGGGIAPADPDRLDRQFYYDPLDRLICATGRETQETPAAAPWQTGPRSTDLTKVRAYAETYSYDVIGNLLALRHGTDASGSGAHTRSYPQAPTGNQMVSAISGSTTITYRFDPCGNQISEASNRFYEWDHANRLATFRDQAGLGTPSIYAQYRYDAHGSRVVKVVRKNSGPDEITLYIGGLERVLIGTVGGPMTPYDDLQLLDGDGRLAGIRRGDPLPDDPMPDQPIRYQVGDQLASVTATLGADGALLNREEYLPYGETSFGSYARKRYRFTAKERDEESGLSYHSARYYAPGLGRWISCDPSGHTDCFSLYCYVRGNPTTRVDRNGGLLGTYTPPGLVARTGSSLLKLAGAYAAPALGGAAVIGLAIGWVALNAKGAQQWHDDMDSRVRRSIESQDWVHEGRMTEEDRNDYINHGVRHLSDGPSSTSSSAGFKTPATAKPRRDDSSERSAIRTRAERVIGAGKHPLSCLLNPATGKLWRANDMYHFDHPVVDAGHLVSHHGGGKAMGLEWAADNRLDGSKSESKGVIMEKIFIDVCAEDGQRCVPVEQSLLKSLANSGLCPDLPKGAAKTDARSKGWLPQTATPKAAAK